ncbi:putative transcriptional regulatory protein [Smittium culicis]|uniref:Putative transcriptional regulatory protein n=1 Tax=Smittium culicis TaxID=133412 RepID=A0A1R1YAF2_9FUNG|nr:putative transcriptional regulatory protein [Smittium culicis]OMJ23815.1 putative transcriptional regulatory protein [Smittium culicis]
MDSPQKIKIEEPPVRLLLSCDRCRQRKVKCDGSKPSCGRCLRSEVGCHYSPIVEKRRARKTNNVPSLDQINCNSALSEVLDIHQEISELMGRLRDISIQTVTSDFIPSSRAESVKSFIDSSRSQACNSEFDSKSSIISTNDFSSTPTSARPPFSKDTCRMLVSNFFEFYSPLITGFDDHSKLERYLLQSINSNQLNPLLLSILSAGSLVTNENTLENSPLSENPSVSNVYFATAYPLLKSRIPEFFGVNSLENLSVLNNCALISLKTGKDNFYSSQAVRMGFCLGLHNPNAGLKKQSTNLFWSAVIVDSLLSMVNGYLPAASYDELDSTTSDDLGKLAIILVKASKKAYSSSLHGTGHLAANSQFSAHLLMELDMWYGTNSENSLAEFLNLQKTEALQKSENGKDLSKKMFLHCMYHFLVITIIQNFSSDVWTFSGNNSTQQEAFINERSLVSARLMTQILIKGLELNPNYIPPCLGVFAFVGGVVYTDSSSLITSDSNADILNLSNLVHHVRFLNKIGATNYAQNLAVRSLKLQQKIQQLQQGLQTSGQGTSGDFANSALYGLDFGLLPKPNDAIFNNDFPAPKQNNQANTLDLFSVGLNTQKILPNLNSCFSDTSSRTAFGQQRSTISSINSQNFLSNYSTAANTNIDDIISSAFSSN